MVKILIVEPYYGGSHKHFLSGLEEHVKAEYTLITLPARKWKKRMQLSAPWVIEQLMNMDCRERYFDIVLASTFVDLSLFRSMLFWVKGWNVKTRFCLYFHENQFVYPTQNNDSSYRQFSAINFNSSLAADSIAFNTEFNRNTFLEGCKRFVRTSSDMRLTKVMAAIEEKSRVLYPGIDFSQFGKISLENTHSAPVIVWNHRWEHDKNPEEFFNALRELQNRRISFKLIVLGEEFKTTPACFDEARKQFSGEILHFGYTESYSEYVRLLQQGDIVVSTAKHEFYGIAVIEAVRAGCVPLLPARLSYPELFEKRYLYRDGLLVDKLVKYCSKKYRFPEERAASLTEQFSWKSLENEYVDWLNSR
jgi:glycosyltransferase involved in cell wall biosynthesis